MPFTYDAPASRRQAKQRERQLAKMEEEGLVKDPDAEQALARLVNTSGVGVARRKSAS